MRARLGLLIAVAAAACSKERPLQGPLGQPVTWEDDIGPLFAADCSSCHSGAKPAGGYRTTSYNEALGPKDAPVAVAGNPDSQLMITLYSASHGAFVRDIGIVHDWIVDSRLAFFEPGVHESGILNPNDDAFHGKVLHDSGWNFSLCQKCHGADFKGGIANVSCTQCHAQGPTSCDTCHGQPPATGAHVTHVTGPMAKKYDCSECHVKPAHFDDPGHLFTSDGKLKDKATITFGALASKGTTPSYDGAKCSSVYCHGSAQPAWTGGPSQASCGSCHGVPPASHDPTSTNCSGCHFLTAPPGGKQLTQLHADGVVEVGDNTGSCSACHGSAQSPAPPRDLAGNTLTTAIGVGAHQAHLQAQHRLSAPIACSACHVVPAKVDDPGHVDHAPPATLAFHDLAVADSASPSWSHASATCSNVYCHGGGAKMADDTAFRNRTPNWTLGSSQAFCGSCHGLPPGDAEHAGISYPDCNRCHPSTVTPNGAIIVNGTASTHINGVIDVVTP